MTTPRTYYLRSLLFAFLVRVSRVSLPCLLFRMLRWQRLLRSLPPIRIATLMTSKL